MTTQPQFREVAFRLSPSQALDIQVMPHGDKVNVIYVYTRQYVDSERAMPIRTAALIDGDYSKEALPYPEMIYAYLGEEMP